MSKTGKEIQHQIDYERKNFETWFLSLDRDSNRDQLTTVKTGEYFYITTQILYEQYKEIRKLRMAMEGIRNDLLIRGESAPDGTRVVNVSASIWDSFNEALDGQLGS